jgi:hypothetical protein
VSLHGLVVAHPLHRNAVLGARELVHEACEGLIRLQVRVVLDHDQQTSQGRGLFVGRLDRLFGRLRARQLGARLGNLPEDITLLLRDSLGGFHQVRDQVVAALQLVLDLRPLCLDRLFLRDELVIGTAGRAALPAPPRFQP